MAESGSDVKNVLENIVQEHPKCSASIYSFSACLLYTLLDLGSYEAESVLLWIIIAGLVSRYLFVKILKWPLGHIELTKWALIGAIIATPISCILGNFQFFEAYIMAFNLFAFLL